MVLHKSRVHLVMFLEFLPSSGIGPCSKNHIEINVQKHRAILRGIGIAGSILRQTTVREGFKFAWSHIVAFAQRLVLQNLCA